MLVLIEILLVLDSRTSDFLPLEFDIKPKTFILEYVYIVNILHELK